MLAFVEGLLHTRPHAEPERKAEEILYPPLRTHVSSKAEDWLTAPMTSKTVKGQCPQAARQPAAHLAGTLREWSLSPNPRSCCHLHLDGPYTPFQSGSPSCCPTSSNPLGQGNHTPFLQSHPWPLLSQLPSWHPLNPSDDWSAATDPSWFSGIFSLPF